MLNPLSLVFMATTASVGYLINPEVYNAVAGFTVWAVIVLGATAYGIWSDL